MKEVAVKGHAHSANQHWLSQGGWRVEVRGLNPDIRWSEYEFEKVFESGREEMGEKSEVSVEQVELVVGDAEKVGIEKSMLQLLAFEALQTGWRMRRQWRYYDYDGCLHVLKRATI